jgi:ATP-dependent helicase YprA (DUF1998 family)
MLIRRLRDRLSRDRDPICIGTSATMFTPFGHTVDGFETQFGTNHLGHFVLVNRVASLLNPGARFVSAASAGHRVCDVDLNDSNFEQTHYDPRLA